MNAFFKNENCPKLRKVCSYIYIYNEYVRIFVVTRNAVAVWVLYEFVETTRT